MNERRIRKRNFNYLTILRGIATIAITFFHLFPQRIMGGFLGVVIFFLMSGFLMMRNLDSKNLLDTKQKLKETLIKRSDKLLPPLYTIMVIGLGISLFFAKDIFTDSIKSTLPVAFGYQNIYQILAGGSYFQRNGNFSIFVHLWYIALQIQYILLFYLLNFLIDRYGKKSYKKFIFLTLVLISFVDMYILAMNESSISRIYYGPDTRMSAIFLGAFLYLQCENIESLFENLKNKTMEFSILVFSFFAIIPFFFIKGESYFTYKYFMIIYTIIVGLLVVFLYIYEKNFYLYEKKRVKIGILGEFLYYLGSRSYHIYLWQYMIQVFFSYIQFTSSYNRWILFLLEMLLLLVLSEISFQIFKLKLKNKFIIAIMVFFLTVFVFASNFIKNTKDQDLKNLEKTISENKNKIEDDNKKALEAIKKNKNKENISLISDAISDQTEIVEDNINDKEKKNDKGIKDKYDFKFTENELKYLKNLSVTAIGDSVLININSYLRDYIPNLYLDGLVGRDMIDGPNVLLNIKNNHGLGDIIIIALGSNGKLEADDFDQIMEISENREVLFVNTSHTQPWQDYINEEISSFVTKTKNAYLIDWKSYASGKKDLFAKDLVHPNVEGSKAYANIIARALLNINHASDKK